MNRREDALKEALQKNEEEAQRWQMFLKENEDAIENMTMFGKRLTVDVMIPIGKKALMPGYLLHTNEVLVSHYQGYFSKCTTSKAKEICEFRIKMAKDHLKKLALEAELWHNKLEKPYAEGIVPSGEEREIIEEFNEEAEKLWKQEHRKRLKQAKQKEREEREKKENQKFRDAKKTDDEIFMMLEEAEIMEELEKELDTLEVDGVNDEMLRKLMSGEMQLPEEKRRLAYDKESTTNAKILSSNIVKVKDLDSGTHSRTNNNVQPNQEIMGSANVQHENGKVGEEEEEALPEEVILIKQQAKYLNVEDQIGFYDYQIQIIKQKLQLLPLRTPHELNEKIHLLSVLEHLEELLEEAEEILGIEELADNEENENGLEEKCINTNAEVTTENKSNENRIISFALEDQILEFRKQEAVTQMLAPKIEKIERDIIKLNDVEGQKQELFNIVNEFPNKQVHIQDRVEQNLKFVAENQSIQDFDLIEKILQSSKCAVKTLHIKFQHSQKKSHIKEIPDTIGSPADIYNLYANAFKLPELEATTLFVNGYEGEEQVKAPVLREADRQSAFTDPKSGFSNPLQAKSILKNKSAVDKENRNRERNDGKKQPKKNSTNKDDSLSAYTKVMNEVIEKPLTEPEPLPDVVFIDAHTPKKRISRFKQMRQGNSTT